MVALSCIPVPVLIPVVTTEQATSTAGVIEHVQELTWLRLLASLRLPRYLSPVSLRFRLCARRDRKPWVWLQDHADPNSLRMVPQQSTIHNNFIVRTSFVGPSKNLYCIDHDDGSSMYNDTDNFLGKAN